MRLRLRQGVFFLPRALEHLEAAQFQMELDQQTKEAFIKAVGQDLSDLDSTRAADFLLGLQQDRQLQPIGRTGMRREGLILRHGSTIIKLFNGGWRNCGELQPVLQRLYPEASGSRRFLGLRRRFQELTMLEKAQYSLQKGDPEIARYFASAEILVRTMAHQVLPETMPLPVILLDFAGEPVGFYLKHDRDVATAADSHCKETLFDLSLGTSYPWNEKLPGEVRSTADKLRGFNVLVYKEVGQDVEEQVLLDERGALVNFARLGYLR